MKMSNANIKINYTTTHFDPTFLLGQSADVVNCTRLGNKVKHSVGFCKQCSIVLVRIQQHIREKQNTALC